MAYYFTPPLVKDRPPFLPDSSQAQKELWQHFENRERGVNVWMISDGSIVQDTATAENSNTDMTNVYPWNPDDPSGPYVTTVYVPPTPAAQVAVVETVEHTAWPIAFFPGGSTTPITAAQVATLEAYTEYGTGYTDCITEA